MKIKQYIQSLMELARKHPNADVIYAKDSEGNDFNLIQYQPAYGEYEKSNGKILKGICVN